MTDPEKKRELHDANNLASHQFKKSKAMMRDIEFTVPIDELYKVVASCNYNINNYYCPVLVKIVDPVILSRNMSMPYLLQVWNRLGEMIFERPLKQPISNWNISGDKFMFQERSSDPHIWLVKMYRDKQSHIFKINMPAGVMEDESKVNSYFDQSLNRLVIPVEKPLDHTKFG